MTGAASLPRPRRMGRIGRVASGAAMVLVLIVGAAAPADAAPSSTLSIEPADDIATSPTVTGSFAGARPLGLAIENISAVDLAVSPTGPTGGDAVTQDGCEVGSGCSTGDVSFTWEVPALEYNGPYTVTATGTYCAVLCLGAPQRASATPVSFRLGMEPAAPTDLKLSTGDDRSVTVSWARNGEPDFLYYALFRKDPGGEFRRLGSDIKQPSSGRPSFADSSAAGTNGGDFVYRVFAVRKGFTGDDKSTKISKASTDRTITVAPPPTTTTNPGDPAGGPVTTVAGEGVDIGSFLSGQAPTLPTPGPIFLDLPDTGFGETLPFGTLPGDDDIEPGEEDAVLPTPRARQVAEFKANRPLIPVAAGLILLVMAGHVRLLNVRTKAAPEKPPPGTYVARALEAARASSGVSIIPAAPDPISLDPIPIDVATAVANGGHHRAPADDDVAGLPVWAEFEPVSALGLLDAPATTSSPGRPTTTSPWPPRCSPPRPPGDRRRGPVPGDRPAGGRPGDPTADDLPGDTAPGPRSAAARRGRSGTARRPGRRVAAGVGRVRRGLGVGPVRRPPRARAPKPAPRPKPVRRPSRRRRQARRRGRDRVLLPARARTGARAGVGGRVGLVGVARDLRRPPLLERPPALHASNTVSSDTAPALSSGSLRLPHLGDCTHDGQPATQPHRDTTSRVASRWPRPAAKPSSAMPAPPG